MDLKTIFLVMIAIIVSIGFGMESYKKWLRSDRASKAEIIAVAAILSLVLTASFSFGLGFPGLPWTFPGYAIGIFLLQWFIDQKAIKRIWKILDLIGKTQLKKRGVGQSDLEALDE